MLRSAVLIDENYALVQKDGWAELRIPQFLHRIGKTDFAPNAVDVADKLCSAGYEVYIVGGAIRDIILGKPTNDFDIATNATNEAIKDILGNVTFHKADGKLFCYAQYPDGDVDVATFYNIPSAYIGQHGVPDFDPNESTTILARNDSFRRDLTVNALYYDMRTNEIVDWHGGLHDLRNRVLDTLTDADLSIRNAPPNAIRALRFKARYGFRFSERLEKAMKDHAAEYLSLLSSGSLGSQTQRMFRGGFAVNSFEVLTDYNVMGSLFPPVKELASSVPYLAFEKSAMQLIDEQRKSNGTITRSLVMAVVLWPAVEERARVSGFEKAVKETLDEESRVYRFAKNERENVESLLRFEYSLTLTPLNVKEATASPFLNDALLILKVRALSDPDAARVLNFLLEQNENALPEAA
ncbi:MAG: hypothetical protein IJ587_05380 [Synergistaceae bacterium]|nr:hypothetical protein [Synergistaceae bacterium]